MRVHMQSGCFNVHQDPSSLTYPQDNDPVLHHLCGIALLSPLSPHLPYLFHNLYKCSEVVTFFNFSKASIGSGSFALPWAVKQSGILVGSAGLVLLGVVR